MWRIQLFGGPILHSANGVQQFHFRSKKVAALLCYLAIHHEKPCSREALIEALWPDDLDQEALPNRFRVTLASLRKQLEPPGFPFGSVVDTSVSNCIALRKGTTSCDLVEFEREYANKNFHAAASIIQAEFLPGMYEEWVREYQIRYSLFNDQLSSFKSKPEATPSRIAAVPKPPHTNPGLPSFLTQYFPNPTMLAQFCELLRSERLITITGTAGIGKTRLSIEAVRSTQLNAIFVPLADCSTEDEFTEAIIKALGAGTQNSRSTHEQLLDALQVTDSTLIILDNIDHLVEPASKILSIALAANPDLRCITTSRKALEIPGETTFRLETLPYPNLDQVEIIDIENYAATGLFLQRVRQSRPDYRPQESHLALIVEICARLQGLPLAIELAAAQISTLSVPEILKQLDQNLLELKSRQRALSPNHRSLRAALASSFEELEPELLNFLGQLACFRGGFTCESARAIIRSKNTEEQIAELVLRSLINAQIDQDPTRYVLLESVRQFAQEQTDPAQFKDVLREHQKYFLDLAAKVDEDDLITLKPLDQDEPNINLAFSDAAPTDPLYWRARIGAMSHALLRGNYAAGMRQIRASQLHFEQIPSQYLKRDWIVATLQILPEVELFADAESLASQLKEMGMNGRDPVAEFAGEINLGLIFSRQSKHLEAIKCHQDTLALAQKTGDQRDIQTALGHLSGSLHSFARLLSSEDPRRENALIQARECAQHLLQIISPESTQYPLANLLLAVAEFYRGDMVVAKSSFKTSYESAVALGRQTIRLYCTFFLSEIAASDEQGDVADRYWDEFLLLKTQTGLVLTSEMWDRTNTRK